MKNRSSWRKINWEIIYLSAL